MSFLIWISGYIACLIFVGTGLIPNHNGPTVCITLTPENLLRNSSHLLKSQGEFAMGYRFSDQGPGASFYHTPTQLLRYPSRTNQFLVFALF